MKFVILLSTLLLLGCANDSRSNQFGLENQYQTPEVLLDGGGSDLISRKSWRYQGNMIERLFSQAMKKDDQLKKLNESILAISSNSVDSTEFYQEYIAVNDEYWNTSAGYLNRIRDSTQRAELNKYFSEFKADYEKGVEPYKLKESELATKAAELESKLVILKLLISADFMKNYQKKELPSIESVENSVEDYDALIEETKTFIEQ